MKKFFLQLFSAAALRAKIATLVSLCAASAFLLIFSFTRLAGGAGSGGATPSQEADPDMPESLGANIDKEEYLKLRAEQVAWLRGWEPGKPFDPLARGRAIREMEQAWTEGIRDGTIRPDISEITWTPIGPAPIPNGQTTAPVPPANVPVSGRVTAIAVDPTNQNNAYVGTAQGGLYRTLDRGATWTPLMDTAASLAIGAVTIDPHDPTTVFVGTGEGNFGLDNFFGVGLYRIKNANNASTAPVVKGPFEIRVAGTGTGEGTRHAFVGTAINKIVVDPNSPPNTARLFVGNGFGRSGVSGDPPSLSGATGLYFCPDARVETPVFSRVDSPSFTFNGFQVVTDIVFEPGSSKNMVVGVRDFAIFPIRSGIYRTTNADIASQAPPPMGTSPTFTVVPLPGSVNSKLAIYKEGVNPAVVYAATETNGGTLLRSTDGGATFPEMFAAANGFCGGQCGFDIAIAVDKGTRPPADDIIYLGGSSNNPNGVDPPFVLVRSDNGGETFMAIDRGLHADFHALTIGPRATPSATPIVYAGNDGGIWRSENANAAIASNVRWISLNNGTFSATQFQSLAVHPTDANFTIGGTQDNGTVCLGTCGPNPSGWHRVNTSDGGFSVIDQSATDTRSVNMYHTYYNFTNLQGYARVIDTAAARDGGWMLFGCGFKGSVNNGMGIGLIGEIQRPCKPTTAILFYPPLARGPENPNTFYFGSDKLWRSVNRGENMALVSQDPIASGFPITAIGIAPMDDKVRIVGLMDGGIFATTTAANRLTSIDPVGGGSVVPDKYIARAVIDPTDKKTAYVTLNGYTGSENHVWKTTNLMIVSPTPYPTATWTNASGSGRTSIPDIPVNAFVINPFNPRNLYAGTDIGVYVSQDGGTTWSPFGSGLPRVAVFDMAIQPTNSILRIATHGKGMWEIKLLPCRGLLFGESFDGVSPPALPANWVASNEAGAAPLWVTSAATPDSTPNHAFVDDPATRSDKCLDTPSIVVTSASALLTFRNYYNLHRSDGGVLEVSQPNIERGAFKDITDPLVEGSFVQNGYNGMIGGGSGNPLADRMAWTGDSMGYITSVVNLGPKVNGKTIKLRFRMGSDNGNAGFGWLIDTILITGGSCTPSPTPGASAAPSGTPASTATPSVTPATPTPTPSPTTTASPTATASPSPTCPPGLTQGFDDITTLPAAGWAQTNHSATIGTTGWFQGTDAVFPAHSGATTSYIAANFNNTTGTNTISNWLLIPATTLQNGASMTFWTRTTTTNPFPDRLQVRMSTNGASTNVGTTATDVGDFTALLLDINPTYTVGGYPEVWTQMTVNITGLPSATLGRLAFRYFVENGGPTGANSNYIGIDTFAFNGPCGGGSPTPSPTATVSVSPTIPPPATPTIAPSATPTVTVTPTATIIPGVTPTPTPAVSPTPTTAQALNLSTRMRVQTGDNVGIGGFIITGSAPKQVLLRAIGPSLAQLGVPDVLADPVLELHGTGGFVTIINDNWRDNPVQEALIIATGIPPTSNLESAIVATLDPGAYTAIVRGKNDTSGIGLVEVYDLAQSVPAKLTNISTRALVGTAESIMIAGFILGNHSGDDRVIVRGIGPSLAALAVPNVLANPTLDLRDGNGALILSNNDWQDNPDQAVELIAAGLAPTNQLESGMAATLPPGLYTALLSGVNSGTGVGLVEVYDRGGPP